MVSGILLAAVLTASPAYDIVTRECHATGKIHAGAPVMVCRYRIWVVGLSLQACKESRVRIKQQIEGEVAEKLEFLCLPEDDE